MGNIVALVLLGALGACTSSGDTANGAATKVKAAVDQRWVGRPAPSFTIARLPNGTGSVADYRGRRLVANLWATWCVPCRNEMPALERLSKAYRARGVVVIGIDEGESRTAVRRFINSLGVTYSILLDFDMRYATALSILGLPTSVFVRPDGTIDSVVTGELDYAQMTIRTAKLMSGTR